MCSSLWGTGVIARADEPRTLVSLNARIRNIAKSQGRPQRRLELAVANTVVGQMLPPGVVKGGTAIKLRVGEAESRFTRDLDASRPATVSLDDYLDALADRLAEGWAGFTGVVRPIEGPNPRDVPPDYIMRPFVIRLAYKGSTWFNITFELGRDEIGSTSQLEERIADDILDLFAAIGLPTPRAIPVLALDHQIAQKLHACTSVDVNGQNERAHDLVDLQILTREEHPDLAAVSRTARRLFAARRAQTWPPIVITYPRWDTIYAAAAEGLDVIEDVNEAVAWTNRLIAEIG